MKIPFHKPYFDEQEAEAVARTLRRNLIGTGPVVASFEKEFGRYIGVSHALSVNSCTGALHLALDAYGIGPGDEVITTPLTFCSTILAILYVGATPVLADIDQETLCLDPAKVAERITVRTKAILPVHYAGFPCALDELKDLCSEHNLILIEDAAHAFNTKYKGIPIGQTTKDTPGAVCFSFHATKALSIGDGGMITTSDAKAAQTMVSKRLFGMNRTHNRSAQAEITLQYSVDQLGYKYNMTDLEASIGRVQLKKADEMHQLRKQIALRYKELLSGNEAIILPHEPEYGEHAWHLYVIRVAKELRDGLINDLLQQGIKTTIHFIPVYRFPYFHSMFPGIAEHLPVMEMIAEELLSLPMFPGLTDEEVSAVASAVCTSVSRRSEVFLSS